MKIRQGFVSNSSSTSFTIFGIREDFDFDVFLKTKFITKKQKKEMEELGEGPDRNLISSIQQKLPEGFNIIYSYDDNDVYIGRDAKSIHDNETGLELKQSAQEFLESVFGSHIKCKWIEETVEN